MIIDFHARLAPRPGATDAMLSTMDECGIGRAVVSAGGLLPLDRLSEQIERGGRSGVAADNAWVRRECARTGGRLLPFFFADPAGDLDTYRAQAGEFRGLEISPAVHGVGLDDRRVRDLVEVAGQAGHPVYVVCLGRPGTRTRDLVRLARDFPAVTFVWGHCGHTGLETAGLNLIAGMPTIVAEISGCLTVTARLAVERLGAHRVVFGTEYPLQHPRVELAKLMVLDLGPSDLRAVSQDNARRLLGEENP